MADKNDNQKAAEKVIKAAGGKQTKDGKWDMGKAVDKLRGK